VRLSEILKEVSHDSVNRFLLRERYTGKDLYQSVESSIKKEGGILSVDDTVLDKPYSNTSKALLICTLTLCHPSRAPALGIY